MDRESRPGFPERSVTALTSSSLFHFHDTHVLVVVEMMITMIVLTRVLLLADNDDTDDGQWDYKCEKSWCMFN